MAHLIVLDGPHKGQRHELIREVTRIGRHATNDFAVDGPSVSGTHCEIRRSAEGLTVVDLQSTNGTYVNDERVDEADLERNDVLKLGSTSLMVGGDELPPGTNSLRRDRVKVAVRGENQPPAPTPAAFAPRRSKALNRALTIRAAILLLLGIVVLTLWYCC